MAGTKTATLNEQLVSIDELCQILKLKKSYIYLLTHQRKIPHYKLGAQLRFKLSEIDDWLTKQFVDVREDINLVDIVRVYTAHPNVILFKGMKARTHLRQFCTRPRYSVETAVEETMVRSAWIPAI